MKNSFIRAYLKKLLILLPWILMVVSVAYLLCKYEYYNESQTEHLWGIIKQTHQEFNTLLFNRLMIGIGIVYLALGFIPFHKNIEKTRYLNQLSISILVLAIFCYFTGLFTPLYETEKLKIFDDKVSLWESIGLLMENEEVYLGILIFTFTILFPILKFVSLAIDFIVSDFQKSLLFRVLYQIGKFSMLDVFIVAVLLLNIQFESVLVDMKLQGGIVFFSISIILSIFLFGMRKETWGYEGI